MYTLETNVLGFQKKFFWKFLSDQKLCYYVPSYFVIDRVKICAKWWMTDQNYYVMLNKMKGNWGIILYVKYDVILCTHNYKLIYIF